MIELTREAAALFLAWSIGLTITYGIVESSLPIVVGMRISLAASGSPGWWGETFVYCPYCIGFWIHGAIGVAGAWDGGPWHAFWRGACLWVMSLLVIRAACDVEFVRSKWSDELEAIKTMRERAGAEP
jgi:hypothetical protein